LSDLQAPAASDREGRVVTFGENGRVSLGELEAHLWESANILRGPIDQADFKSYMFPLLFLKRISDVYDEEFQQALDESNGDVDYASFAENHRFQRRNGLPLPPGHGRTPNVDEQAQSRSSRSEKAYSLPSHEPAYSAPLTTVGAAKMGPLTVVRLFHSGLPLAAL
jgi:type I restriction-modification system DNA methylase subunit